jgi:hypothetical protein
LSYPKESQDLGHNAGARLEVTTRHVLKLWALGKIRPPDVTSVPAALSFASLASGVELLFRWIEFVEAKKG